MHVETFDDVDSGPDGFIDTAAMIANLDLVVTCDTAIGHLAGALGKPTWLALKKVPNWRWFLDRTDSPWYPSIRLYRQENAGDWDGVLARMAEDLKGFAQ
jgi:ADP-heptose:LPS heptosyltransferase